MIFLGRRSRFLRKHRVASPQGDLELHLLPPCAAGGSLPAAKRHHLPAGAVATGFRESEHRPGERWGRWRATGFDLCFFWRVPLVRLVERGTRRKTSFQPLTWYLTAQYIILLEGIPAGVTVFNSFVRAAYLYSWGLFNSAGSMARYLQLSPAGKSHSEQVCLGPSTTKIDCRKTGTLVLTSVLEDLVVFVS